MEDNITALYNELKGKYEINSEDDFRSYLSDANNREALRKELEAEYDVGDSASFSNYLGFNQEQPQQQPSSTDTTSAETPAVDQQKPETVVGSQQWRENIVNVPGDHSYNGKSYGEVYDQIIQEYGKNLTKQQGDPYAEARAQIMQAGITDDLRPEDADKLALDIRHGYANRYAGNASKEMVSALPDQVPNIDDLMDGLWYTRDMQQRVNHEASRLGLRKENYVNYYMKPQLAKALSDRYGYDVQSAKLIAGRLLSQDEHTNEVIRQNEAAGAISEFAAPIINEQFKKIQEVADKVSQQEREGSGMTPYGNYGQMMGGAIRNWQATDPEKVWEQLKPVFDNMGSWMGIVGNEEMFDKISQMAEAEGMPVNAYIDQYIIPAYANTVQKEFERIAVEREMPKNTYDYIVQKMGESLVGSIGKWMLASEARRRAQGEAMQLTDTGQGEYKPGFGAKVAGGAAAMLPDMVMPFGGPFGLTAKLATKPLRGVAQELITSGTRPLLARITQASLSGSASLGAFEGLKGAIEGGINPTGYEHLLAEDKRSAGDILLDVMKGGFERGIPSAVTGATMIGGPIGQKISNGRGLLANLAGWGTQVGVDAGLATAINIPKVVSGAITSDDLKDEFFENIGTFAALGLHSKGKEFANLASGGRSINGVEFTKPEIESIEDRYLMPLRDVINKIDEAQSKRSLITKSRLGIDEAQEKRDAITEVGTEIFNDMLYSYGVPADLKVKVCTAFNLPVPENALKPKVLETTDKVVSDAVSEGFDDKVNQDYNKPGGVLDKLKKGESLSDYELTLRLLIQDNKRYNEIGEKLQAGNQLTEDEMAFVNQYNSRIDSIQAKMFSQELDRMASDFEKRNDLKKGTIKRMFAVLKAGKGVEDAYMLDKFESELDEYSKVLDEIKAARQQQESAPTENTLAPVDEAPKINKAPDTEVPVTDEASGIKEFPTEEIPEDVTEEVAPQMDRSELADKLTNGKTGTIMEVMLADGRKAYIIDGDPGNDSHVTLANENGDIIKQTDGNGYTIDRLPVNLLARDEAGNIIMNEQTVGEYLGGNAENTEAKAPAVKDNLTTDQSAMSRIPVTDGVHQFEQAKPEDTLAALRESLDTPEELAETIDEQISDLTNELQQLTKAPKGKNKKVLTMDEKLQKKSAIKELQQRIDYWNSVKEALNKPTEEQKPAEVEQPAAEIEQKEPVIEQEAPVTEQAPTAEETAQMKIAQGNIKSNLGKNYEFQNQDGTRSVVTLKSFKGDNGVEVMRQDFDAEGNPKGSPYSQELKTLDVSGSIINGFMKPVLTPEEQLREQYKGRKSIQDVLDVVTDEEMLKIIQASQSGDSDTFNSLIDEYRNDHIEDLILKDRDERNAKVAEIMDGPGTRESKLRRIRKIYQEGNFEDAVTALEDDSLAPVSVDEIVADLHSRQPKKGEGPIAYFSYTAPDGHKVIGMQDESGHGKKTSGDTKGYAPWLAPQGKGMSLTQYAENLRSQMTEAQQEQYDVQDVRNAVIDLFGSAEKPSDITTMSIKNGVLQAEQAARRMEDHWIDNVSYQKVSHDENSFAGRLAKAKQTTNTEPTEAQKEKGNYKKGHVSFGGYDYVIENPEGSMRRGKDADGKEWEQKMNNTYGYILGKYGKDGDHLDMFINDGQDLDNWNGKVYVVDQIDPKTGLFDEHKVMYGFNSEAEARDAYLSNYEKGWNGLGAITGVSKEAFDKWLDSSKRKLIRFADHSITKEALEKQANEPATDADIELAFRDKIMDIEKNSGVPLTTDMKEAMPILNRENGRDEQSAEETIKSHKVDDAEELKQLENQPTVKRYRAMQLIDGKLYPPMSAKVDGEMRQPTEIGVWEKAEERPDLVKNGKFVLNKAQKGQGNVPAAYNPYFHTSTSGLNDQFTSAYKRPELVVVEVEIPESELTSGYKAEGAKDAVGDVSWHSGVVNGQLPADRQRQVTLSRYSKVNRIVPDSEVAEMIAKQLEGTNVEVPYNVVTPSLRAELEKQGVKISDKPAGSVTEDANGNRIRQQKAEAPIFVTPGMKESVMEGQPMFFKTNDGYAYGFTYRGKIYIDPSIATSETPIHEYGHLWAEMKRQSAPEEWNHIKQTLLADKLIEPFIEKVKRDYPELTGDGKEDDFVEEVLTQFSGKHGAEKLRKMAQEIKKELGDDAAAETIAEAAIRRVKSVLNDFWKSVCGMMGWKYTNAEEIADAVLRDLLNGVNPAEKIKEMPKDLKSQGEVERTLMGMHNISEDKLKKAIKLGGLANPSMAVVDTNNGVLDNFGEISLIPKSDLIDKKKGRNVGTWASDAYTPRFPKTYIRISDKNRKALDKWLDSLDLNDEMRYQLGQQFNDYYNSFSIKDNALQYAFLKEKGLTDKVDYVRHDDVSPAFLDLVDKYGDNIEEMIMRTRDDEAFRKEVSEGILSHEISNAMKDVRRNEGETAREYMDRRKKEASAIRKLLTDENDMATFDLTDHFLRDNARKMHENGKFDGQETLYRTRRYISDNGLSEEYAKYFADKAEEFGIEEMVANGHDRNGHLKFKPITLEDISKQMKKEGRAGGEGGFGDSPGALRAKLTPMLNSLEEMRKEKGRLVSHEDFEAEKDPYFEKVFHIQHDLFNGDYDDMLKVLRTSDMETAAKRLGYDLTPEEVDDLKVFKNLTMNLPTEYFETKFERPVMLNEFEIAVVPENTDPKVIKALKDAGLDVRTYSSPADNPDGGRENRRNAIMDAVTGRDDIRFQMVGEKGAAEADKAEGVKTRQESLKVAEELEKADKSSKAIKFATGWERGKDGKWRYETVDEKADILDDYNQKIVDYNKKRAEFHKEQGRLLDLYDRMGAKIPKRLDSKKYSEEEQAKFREMRKEREKVWKQYMASNDQEKEFVNNARDGHTTKLVDLLGENHELFKYYPQLKDVAVRYANNMQQGVAGSYNDKDGIKISIDQMHVFGDNKDLNNDNLNGILVHEIQHAIQDIEGFAKGGNLYTATTEAGINAIVQKKQSEQAAIANKIDMFNKWLNNPEELKLISQLDRRTVEEEKKHLEEQLDDLSYQHNRIGMYIDKIKHDKAPAMSDARDLYSRLAGEVEARNASERINMSEEDRRNTPIEKTEDYARENQVVMMDYPENGEKDSISFKDIKPIGKGVFGDIYDQFKGKAKEAFKFLLNKKGGDVLSVFHRNDVGDINLVWGDAAKEMGLDHIISKHVGPGKDFETVDDAFSKIESVINNGKLIQNGKQRYVVSEDGYRVGIRKDFNGIKKNWVVTAVDYNRSKEEKGITTNPTSASHGAEESELAALRNSSGKDKKNIDSLQEKNEKSADEMPRFSKVSSPEPELTPEERQYWNKWDADMKKWKEQNALPANAEAPGPETPKQPDETMMDYILRITKERKQRALWLTAPKLEDYQRMRTDKDTLESAREEEQKYPDSPSAKMRRIAAEFQQIRSAMSRQKAYDKSTVKAVTDFAQNYMRMGFGDNLSRGDVERMLSSVKNAVGAKTVKKEIDNIMNILTDNYLRNLEQQVVKLSSIRELRKNVQGVEVQGKLELKGQRMIQAFRSAMEYRLNEKEIREKLGEVAEKMARNDEEAPMWEQEFEGLSIALQYVENVETSRKEWAELDRQYKEAVKEYKDSNRSYQAQQELLASIENAMMENKIERIGMYGDIIGRLQGNISESMKGAHEFIEREKERIKHIQQIANFDLAGKDMGAIRQPGKLSRIANSTAARFFLGPLATFEQMLKQFGGRSVNGEGYLYNHFMRKWMDATDNAFVNETKAKEELDEKAREVFGDEVKRWSDLYKLSNQPGMEVKVNDQGEDKTLTLTQGNMLYIYMANKMNDGKMKLRKMGITEEDVEAIKEALDPRLVQLGDWIQEDYLPKRRVEYNKVYERMFGAPMATIENYFPIKVLGDARYQEKDVNTMDQDPALPSTITGNIIKRTKNALPLDILNTDAVSLALEHIEDMERWAAQAEFNKDINTLLSYTTFRNKVKNMNTIYGSGDQLWNNFADTARMAAGTYRPKAKPGSVDKTISNIAKGVTAAKISFRMYTAFKQILSAPAFAHDVDLGNFIKNSVNPYGSWKWAMENMPVFQKRWKSRQVGDTRLMDDPTDWKMWKNNIVQMAARMGMSPNALVDGITCAVGARSIYESRLKKYTEMGLSEAEAEKRALQDAEIGYNLTQQSSEGAFVSAIQKDRTVAANMLSVFRNSSMAYTRQWVDAARNLSHMAQKGFKEDSIEFMTRQFQDQLGLDQEQAEEVAEKEYARAQRHELAKLLNMMFGVTVAWNLGAYLPYMLIGDDDETKKEMMKDALLKGLAAGPTEGLAAGNIISELTGRALSEKTRKVFKEEGLGAAIDEAIKQSADYEINPLPLFADIQGMIKKGKYDKLAAAQDLFNIIAQSSVGVNPQTFTDIWNAAMDYGAPAWDGTSYSGPDADNLSRPKEFALFIMRLMNAPTSSWRNKYIDELDMSADDAKKLSYEEMAKRYAHYKHWKDAPVMGWLRSDEERQEKMKSIRKQFKKAVAERMGRTVSDMNDEAVENLSDKMDSKDMIDILQKEITRRVQKSIENMDDYQLEQEFDSSQRPFKRKLIAKNLSKRTGASSDPYGDKPSADYEQLYQELRTGADVTEDAELLNMQENARDRGDEKRKDEISKKRSKLRNKYIKGEKGAYGLKPGDDKHNKAVMEKYRKARRELYDSLRR